MELNNEELNKNMSLLYKLFNEHKIDITTVIKKSVQLGMDYQEHKIRTGIDIVFNNLNKKL